MERLRVAVYEKTAGPGLSGACRALQAAGYDVTGTTDPALFQKVVPSANCAVVLAYRLAANLIPSRLDGAYVPPVIVTSPLHETQVTRELQSVDVLHHLLEPAPRDPVLVNAVTHAVIADIFARLNHAADRHPGLPELVRSAIRAIVNGNKSTVTWVSRSLGVSLRTLERHWLDTFEKDAPRAKDFIRGIWILRIFAAAVSQPVVVWSHVCERLEIRWTTFREGAVALAGRRPSELDLAGDPAAIIEHVCGCAIPQRLLEPMLSDEIT